MHEWGTDTQSMQSIFRRHPTVSSVTLSCTADLCAALKTSTAQACIELDCEDPQEHRNATAWECLRRDRILTSSNCTTNSPRRHRST